MDTNLNGAKSPALQVQLIWILSLRAVSMLLRVLRGSILNPLLFSLSISS